MNTLKMLPNRAFTPADFKIAEMMSSYWVNFFLTGDPNGPGLPKWSSYSDQPDRTMELGDKNEMIPVASGPAYKFFEHHIRRD